MVPAAVRLLRSYDVDRLVEDLETCERLRFTYVSQTAADGNSHHVAWTVLPLRSRGGRIDDGSPGTSSIEPYQDTVLLQHTPYFRELLEQLGCPMTSVRLSALAPGGVIRPHNDGNEFELGKGEEIRLHVPIVTNDAVLFTIDNQHCRWEAGELWYGDFSKEHTVENRGTETRIHLLITTRLSQSLIDLFPADYLIGRQLTPYPTPLDPPAALRDALELDFALECDPELEAAIRRDADDPFMDDMVPPALRTALLGMIGGPASIRWVDGRLRIVSNGQPTFHLALHTSRQLRIVDEAAYFEFDLGRKLENVKLHLHILDRDFTLPARIL